MGTYIILKFWSLLIKLWFAATAKWAWSVLALLFSFFYPIGSILLVLFFAIALDFLTGLAKAVKIKNKITSFRLRDSIIKLFLYLSIICIIYAIEVVCFPWLLIHKIVSSFIILSEILSFVENVETITQKKIGLIDLINNLKTYLVNLTKKQ